MLARKERRFKPRDKGALARQAKAELSEAREVFDRLVALEAAYDPRLADLYAPDAVMVETTLERGVVRRSREIPAERYCACLPEALENSRKAGATSSHANILAHHLAPGWVAIRTLRSSSLARAPAPYEVILRREPIGWRIARETAAVNV